jgi:hypothetical protein
VYSDFYEIPLPALRFEKVEENSQKKEVNETEENDAFYIDHVRSTKQKKRHTRTTYDAHQLNQARITASSKHAEETTFKERRFQHTERHAEQRR